MSFKCKNNIYIIGVKTLNHCKPVVWQILEIYFMYCFVYTCRLYCTNIVKKNKILEQFNFYFCS